MWQKLGFLFSFEFDLNPWGVASEKKTSLKAQKNSPRFGSHLFYFFKLVSSSPWPFCCFYLMYASFRSVTDKNSKILIPTRTGNFLLTSMDREFYTTKASNLSLTRASCSSFYPDWTWRLPILLKLLFNLTSVKVPLAIRITNTFSFEVVS